MEKDLKKALKDHADKLWSGETAIILSLTIILTAAFFGAFLLGRYPVPPGKVVAILASRVTGIQKTWPDAMETVVLRIRFPRIAAALLIGGALSAAGASYQSLFRNPLVSPSILGVSAGAAFGVSLAMLLSLPWAAVQTAAFILGLLAAISAVAIAGIFGNRSVVALVVSGMVVAAFFEGLISAVKYVADPLDTLPSIIFWLMGGLSKVTLRDLKFVIFPIIIPLAVLYAIRWQINVLSIGEDEAAALGVNIRRTRIIVIVCTTMMTAAAVSISGIIGWIGLIIPHMARMFTGSRFQMLLPMSFLMGSSFLLLADNLGRSVSAVDIPLGILTALLGAPLFIFLMKRLSKDWI